MTDVSLAGAFLAGLISFLSPCVLPLVPGYISMLSGIGVEQLRQGEQPKGGLFSSALSFVVGFSVVFISFGASASAVGGFLQQHKNLLTPIAGALILLFGLHLLGRANQNERACRHHAWCSSCGLGCCRTCSWRAAFCRSRRRPFLFALDHWILWASAGALAEPGRAHSQHRYQTRHP